MTLCTVALDPAAYDPGFALRQLGLQIVRSRIEKCQRDEAGFVRAPYLIRQPPGGRGRVGVNPDGESGNGAFGCLGDLRGEAPVDQTGGKVPAQVDDPVACYLGDQGANLWAHAREGRYRFEKGKEYFRTLGHRSGALVRGKLRP